MKKYKNVVVGAGVSGAVIANKIAFELGEEVLLVDRRDHIAGNCRDYFKDNIYVQEYGSHIFHTNNENVWEFLSKFCDWFPYSHKVFAVVDGKEINIPFNLNSLYLAFDNDFAQKLEKELLEKFEYNKKISIMDFMGQAGGNLEILAKFIYEKIFYGYTKKQWGKAPDSIDLSVLARVPVYISRDDRYFQDKFQGIPKSGYSAAAACMLNHPLIELRLGTDFSQLKEDIEYERLFYTGSIDEFFDYKFGVLPYRSLKFEPEEHDIEFYQDNSVINYPNDHDYTRISEYKHYLDVKSDKTIIAKEYSLDFEQGKNERYYPIVNSDNLALYNKYKKEAEKLNNVYFFGRLGDYKYYNIDEAVSRALEIFEEIRK